MTQTGKCDTCRQRKVKCDEEKPKCGACRKKNRSCLYSYGKASAFVMQDPNQLTKHGKSKVAAVIHTLDQDEEDSSSSASTPSDLQVTTERAAENGQGFFQTLAPSSKRRIGASRKAIAYQRRKLELYLQYLQEESAITALKPSSSETTLISRYIAMLGSETAAKQPLSILGTWIQSIPSRIGANTMMDLAVEFFVNSHDVYWDDTYSKRSVAQASKEKALKSLQLIVFNTQDKPTYEVLLATKMHYAAEALLGIDSMMHAIHAFGLAELLKTGATVANVDDEHFWNLIDNTYIDDVNEAMLAGRNSVYDNDFYLSSTYPPPLSSDSIVLSAFQRASMAIMHVFVQCPRLNILVRRAITHPEDTAALVDAVTLAESLWQLNLADQVSPLLKETTTISPTAPFDSLADILTDSLDFDSVQSMILCTRFWMLTDILGGLVDTLYRYFPTETGLSLLPDRYVMHRLEVEAAICIAKSIPFSVSISQSLPLVPLRLHTPLQISIGPWYRTIRRLTSVRSANPGLEPEILSEIARTIAEAERMKGAIIAYCNRIHEQWDVSIVSEKPLLEALNTMAGEQIPDWLPVRVRFEAEDGNMVMKLDYENKSRSYQENFNIGDHPPKRVRDRDFEVWRQEVEDHNDSNVYELPDRSTGMRTIGDCIEEVYSDPTFRSPRSAADYIHGTGRNLCSTSGWWPANETTETVSSVLLDSTHKASAFSKHPRQLRIGTPDTGEAPLEHIDRHPCLASSFWPQTLNKSTALPGHTPKNVCLSPAWASSNYMPTTFDDRQQNVSLSPSWTSSEFTTPSSKCPSSL
ncbi:hypothetical protein CC86DRAFT_357432 [Ophiobolus disseminans]|uniref:Zn(2)-C6 fungal-type domain-containing protein n=1 Tax=Ophiobolus disseminans TaxID=1469910 RepID=A0A6A6ZPK0_9PLEO|nr:hypothetical protein CC86DRAFT_357432 [Ophiobolus disseminans]